MYLQEPVASALLCSALGPVVRNPLSDSVTFKSRDLSSQDLAPIDIILSLFNWEKTVAVCVPSFPYPPAVSSWQPCLEGALRRPRMIQTAISMIYFDEAALSCTHRDVTRSPSP